MNKLDIVYLKYKNKNKNIQYIYIAMTDRTANKMAAATTAATTFYTANKTPILISLAVALVLGMGYYYYSKQNEYFNGGRQYPRGYKPSPSYPGRETMHGSMRSPQREGFNDGNELGSLQNIAQGIPKSMVLFFAPWCPHCKSMIDGEDSAWNALFRKYNGRKGITIDKINCDEKPEVATKYGIGGFPTIMLFQGDKTYTYDGDRSLGSLERFLDSPTN